MKSSMRFASSQEVAELEQKFSNCYREMIQNGADINYADWTGFTASMLAAYFRQDALFQLLKEKGANMDARDDEGYTAYDIQNSVNDAINKHKASKK